MRLIIHAGEVHTVIEYTEPALLSSLLTSSGSGCSLPCGGRRRCHACRIRAAGELEPPSDEERRLLTGSDIRAGIRYACMTTACGDAEVWTDAVSIRTGGASRPILPEPWASGYLAAIDLGTTTIAGLLTDSRGRHLADAGLLNPQCVYGADVITRAERALHGEGEALARAARSGVNALIKQLAGQAGIGTDEIGAICIAGNTCMEYLLAGKNPATLVRAPFSADERFGTCREARELGLLPGKAACYCMPCISAFIGGDVTAGILTAELTSGHEPCLLLDIGTNGETVLWDGRKLLCCSAAAGPAFEGAGLSCGMPAQPGAIAHVRLEGGMLVRTEVIGDAPARGLCGSGLLDALAVFLDMGLIDETGAIDEAADTEGYVTAEGALRVGSTDVILTQADIRTVQTAKSAIRAGVETLLQEAGLAAEQLAHVYLAGGFGTCLCAESACRTGLLPETLADRTAALGNTALAGTACAACSRSKRAEAEAISTRAHTISLAEHPVFAREFMHRMLFPRKE